MIDDRWTAIPGGGAQRGRQSRGMRQVSLGMLLAQFSHDALSRRRRIDLYISSRLPRLALRGIHRIAR